MKLIFSFIFLALFSYGDFIGISAKALQEKINQNVVIVDIRTPPEWKQTGIIPTSKKIMFFDQNGKYDVQSWLNELTKYVKDKNQPFVLVCRSGNRTGTVGNFLDKKLGYKNVFHLENGIKSWLKEKREVERD